MLRATVDAVQLLEPGAQLKQHPAWRLPTRVLVSVLVMTHFACRFMPAYGKRACGANSSARLSRSDFDLGEYVPLVSDIVTLYVSVKAIKED